MKSAEALFARLLLQATVDNARARGINIPPLTTRRSGCKNPIFLVLANARASTRPVLIWAGQAERADDAKTRAIEEMYLKPADDANYTPTNGLDRLNLQQAMPL